LLLRRAQRFCERRPARIVHQNVETAVLLDGGGDQRLDSRVLLEVACVRVHVRAGLRLDFLRRALEIGGGAAAHDDFRAFGGEHFGARVAQTLAGAADDRHLAF
jgi:hypothetical protein